MGLFVWKRPAWFDYSNLDHTWVTDYDLTTSHSNHINNYWYCKGDLYTSSPPTGLLVSNATPMLGSTCLVIANDPSAKGTIRYGIDGVCHQIANQVLYPTGQKLTKESVRGYLFSHGIFGAYGRREHIWDDTLQACHFPVMTLQQKMEARSFLHRRAMLLFGFTSNIPVALKKARNRLLYSIDRIGLRPPGRNEATADRARELNFRVNVFLNEAARILEEEAQQLYFEELFGFPVGTEINLIDPEKFQFADNQDNAQ